MVQVPSVTLSDGNEMPLIGLGTYRIEANSSSDPGYEAIKIAIKCGYRFIDTAALYLNEEGVGQAVAECIAEGIVKREDLFICTKVWCTAHKRESVMKAAKESLKRLQMSYVDLYLIHWPMAFAEDGDSFKPTDPSTGKIRFSDIHYTETWQGMEDVKDAGLAKSIGVSNFNHEMTGNIFAMPCKHRPTVNQVECHVYLSQEKLLEYSKKNNIFLTAYCPLGSVGSNQKPGQPNVLEDPVVHELAKKYNKSVAQILIRHLIQRNISTIPKSVTPKRIEENFNVFDFELSQEDMQRLLGLNKNLRYCELSEWGINDHPLNPFKIEF